jgi:hypothetical protein
MNALSIQSHPYRDLNQEDPAPQQILPVPLSELLIEQCDHRA